MEYYYVHKGEKKGPFSLTNLYKEEIQIDTLVWFEGLKEWTKAGELSELKEIFKVNPPAISPPPVPDSQLTKKQKFDRISEKVLPKKDKTPILSNPFQEKDEIKKDYNKDEEMIKNPEKNTDNFGLGFASFIVLIFLIIFSFFSSFRTDKENLIIIKITSILFFAILMRFWILKIKNKTINLIGQILTWLLGIIFTLIVPHTLFDIIIGQNIVNLFFALLFYIFVNLYITKKKKPSYDSTYEEEKLKLINPKINELLEKEKKNIPDWYTGAVDSKGSKIKVDERGNEITLNGLETSIYNLTKTNNLLIGNIQKYIESGKTDKIILEAPIYRNTINQLKQGKVWLKENNIEAYKVLFNDVEDNTASSNDKSESSHYQIASDYEKSGKYKLAVEHYTKSIETDPNHVYSFVNRGRIYDEVTGQLKLAIADYTQAINIDPNDATIYYNRGNVLTKLKKYDDGIKDFTKAIEIDPNNSSSFKNRGLAKQRAGIDPSSDWKKACSLGIEECCIWYEEDMKRDSQTSDADKYLKDIMLEHFIKFPPIPTYYSWLKKVANDNELKEDQISENKENFYTLLQLCGKVISPESEKQIKYFKDLSEGYISSDEEKAKKESDIFLNKLNNYEDSYQYFESIVRRLSDYNKLVFIYTIWDLLLINFEGQDVNLEENFYTGNIEPAFWLGDILADEGLLVEFFEIKNREGIVGLMVARRVLKLQTENMISKKLSNLEEQEKDIIIYLMYNFLVRKKNRKIASREYGHIISLLNYDLNRIIKSNVSSPEEFVSENNALNWLNNADDESKNFVEVLIQRIIVSDFHYSFSEQTYLSKITEGGNLSGMYRENKTHVWLRSICDSDKKVKLDKLSTQLKTQAEINKEINEEQDLIKQEKLYKSAIKKFPNWSEIKNSYCYNLYEQKKFKEGIKIIQDLMYENPRYYDTCGLGYYYLEEYEKALELMNKCIQLDPTGKNCYVNEHYLTRGNVFIKMNQISNAKQDFKAALNFNYPYFKKHGNPKLKKSMEKLVENALLKCI